MGRFYNASADTPQFIDGMYTPPWELINKKLEENQQGYDNVLATTNLFNDIDIQHIDDPVVKEQAQKIKDYYTQKSEAIANAIKEDPTAWRKAMPNIQNLSRELQKDMKTGDIFNMQQQYASLAKFAEDNKELKANSPEDYNRALGYYLKKWKEDPLRKKSFDWENVAKPIDQDKLIKDIQAIKASATETANGMYIVGDKTVPKDQIDMAARAYVYGRPENAAYLAQQIKFGNPDYYNEEYAKMNPGSGGLYEQIHRAPSVTNPDGTVTQGKILTDEEFKNKQIKYQNDMNAYMKRVQKGDKNAVAPKADWETNQGAIGRMLQEAEAMGYHSEHTLKSNTAAVAMQTAKMHIASQEAIASANLKMQKYKIDSDENNKALSNINATIGHINKAIDMIVGDTPQKQQLIKDRDALMAKSMQASLRYDTESTGANNPAGKEKTTDKATDKTTTSTDKIKQGVKLDAPMTDEEKNRKYADALATINADVPSTFAGLKASAKSNPGSRNEKLFSQTYWRAKQDVEQKIEKTFSSTPKTKEVMKKYGQDFMNYYQEHLDLGVESAVKEFFNSKLENEGLPILKGDKVVYKKKDLDLDDVKKFNAYRTSLIHAVEPAVRKQEDWLSKKENFNQHNVLFPVSDIGSKNLVNAVVSNPTAFSFCPVDEFGNADTKTTLNKNQLSQTLKENTSNFKVDKAFLNPVGNSHSDAFYMVGKDGKRYLVYPNNTDGKSEESQVIRTQILSDPGFTTSTDNGFRFKNSDAYKVDGKIVYGGGETFRRLDNQLKNDVPLSMAGGKEIRVAKFSVPYGGEHHPLRIVEETKDGQKTYQAYAEGTDTPILPIPANTLDAALTAVNKTYGIK